MKTNFVCHSRLSGIFLLSFEERCRTSVRLTDGRHDKARAHVFFIAGVRSSQALMHHSGYNRHMRNDTGFTLLELIVVIFLITLMIGISAVLFTNLLPSQKFHATVRDISATIRQARSLAQIHGEQQTVVVDLDARQYGIEGRGSRNIPDDVYMKIEDPVAGEIVEGKYRMIFHAAGGIEGGMIVLWNSKRTVRIQPDPIVGTVVLK
ncbi:MAG: prepilin-type N-terminal cleavage/methylation domain-containing protein [Nitrospirota bacterium]